MAKDAWHNFGWVYGRIGSTRGSTTSSGVFTVDTGFARQVVIGFALEEGTGLRNSVADPALSTGLGTYAYYRFLSTNPTSPTVARFRAYRSATISAASAVTTLSRKESLATSITRLLLRWVAFGY